MFNLRQLASHRRATGRTGFTMIELLVVIGIIGLLIVLSVTVYANFIALSKEQATAATINKIDKILQQRKEAFDRLDMKDPADKYANSPSNSWLNGSMRLAEVIVRKQRFQRAFPQRAEERSTFNGVDYNASNAFTSMSPRATFESSALLYLAITQGETFGAPAVDEDAFSANEIQTVTVGTQTVKYFVDAWGQPLRFYRWPTSLIKPAGTFFQVPDRTYASLLISSIPPFDKTLPSALGFDLLPGVAGVDDDGNAKIDWLDAPTNTILDPGEIGWPGTDDPEPLNRDPDDPLDLVYGFVSFQTAANRTSFRNTFQFVEATFHTPLIVSAGPKGILGLFEPNETSSLVDRLAMPGPGTPSIDALSDNITNLNQRNKGN